MTAVSLLSFGGDQGCQLWSFWVQVVILPLISASLMVLFSYLVLLDCLCAQEQIQGELQLWLQATAIFSGGKKGYWACQPSKYGSDPEKFKWAVHLGGKECEFMSLCSVLSMHGRCSWVAAAFIRQGCSSGVWSHTPLGVSSVWNVSSISWIKKLTDL